jgi:Domain of unknown function (DUF222)
MFDRKISPNGRWCVGGGSALPGPGRDEDPSGAPAGWDDFPAVGSDHWRLLPSSADWPDWTQDEAYLAALAEEDEPGDPDGEEDPDNAPPPGLDDAQLAALIAEARQVPADQAAAAWLRGRRGPGMPGSARRFPGECAGPSAGFGSGRELDAAPGGAVLALFAEEAAGDDDCYRGASEDELVGVICAWDRAEAYMAARKHAAVAEFIRRRPADGSAAEGPGRMPAEWEEFLPVELAAALGDSRSGAENVLDLAQDLAARLPGTAAAFRSGIVSRAKAAMIARVTGALDPGESAAAETLVLGRAGRLTPGGLRAAIGRAVMKVAPDKARKRREQAARLARVERWAEDSGNAALAGRELPAAQVFAADQRVTWWARQLKQAGLDGDMDQLRARAYLDILLGLDSRPGQPGPSAGDQDGRRGGGPGPAGQRPDGGPRPGWPLAGPAPPGFAGKVNLTVPLATALGLADRPGEIPGIGPIDPGLARDLVRAAARSPRTTWCVTVTDRDGHAIGHGCARPGPAGAAADRTKRAKPGTPGGPDPPPGGPAGPGTPGFAFTTADPHGPPGGYGTWKLTTGEPGQRDLIVALGPIAVGECDHRYQARGHDPGVMLRHLTQIRHATCTGPGCRRPAVQCDFEHNTPYEAGGRTCECNGGPKCRRDHRLKQHPRWKAEQPSPGIIIWTTPAGRRYATEPTRYPI